MSLSPTGPLPDEFRSRDKIRRTPKRDKSRNEEGVAEFQPHLGSGGEQPRVSREESSKPTEEKEITPEGKEESSAAVIRNIEERSEGDGDIG